MSNKERVLVSFRVDPEERTLFRLRLMSKGETVQEWGEKLVSEKAQEQRRRDSAANTAAPKGQPR